MAVTQSGLIVCISSDTTPNIGVNVVLTYTITNSGPLSADGVTASLPLPSGLSYVSDTGGGDYNSASNVWTIPSPIVNGGTASIQITAYVNASGIFDVTSEIFTSNQTDPNSTPGNGNTAEDDYATITLNPSNIPQCQVYLYKARSKIRYPLYIKCS